MIKQYDYTSCDPENDRIRKAMLEYGLSFPDTYVDAPFRDQNWQLVRVKNSKKAFLWTYEKDGWIHLNVKVTPESRDFWRHVYESVIPGWHQNRDHWNTVILDGTIPEEDVRRMIAESYDLVTDSPTKRIYEAVKKIPAGHVATYALIAEMAGDKKMARAVGNALHKNPDPEHIPCFRVVNSKGECSGSFAFPQLPVYEEGDLEEALVNNLSLFFLELGKGFTYVGRQQRMVIGGRTYKVDLVFYHRILKCFVLIDLKRGEVLHEDIGQMNFYLNYYREEVWSTHS